MDYVPIVVMLIFVLVGGVIAVFADELGRRIGKRRLTLHRKIRPKTSARILAFTSGVLITIVTIILIGLASSDLRTLLMHGRQAISDQKEEISKLGSERDRLAGDNTHLSARNADLATQVYKLESLRKTADAKLSSERAKLTHADALLASLRSRASNLQSKVDSVRGELAAKSRELSARQADLDSKRLALTKLQQKYDYVSKDYVDLQHQSQDLMNNVITLEKQKSALQQELSESRSQLDSTRTEIKDLETTRDGLQQQVEAKKNELAKAQDDLRQVTELARSGMEHTRLRPIIFSVGEEMVRVFVPKQTSKDAAREKIESAIIQAREVARSRGAKNANDIEVADLHEYTDGKGRLVTVESQKENLALEMAGASEDQVLIVYAPINAFVDEGVLVAIKHQPNPVVYRPGQVLAEVRVDGRLEPAKILSTLNGLGAKIRARALDDRMIPVQNGDGSFGSASSEDILLLYNQIRSSAGSVRVQAIAKRETRAADPLLLSFVVK